jgi:hypothetical protein
MTDRAGRVGVPTLADRAKRGIWRFGVPVAAVVGGIFGGGSILSWGLVTPFFVVWPITVGSAALVSALGAGWVGTFLATDGTRSRLLGVVGTSEVAAAVLAVVFPFVPLPPGFLLLGTVVIIALAASWSTWRLRAPGEHIGREVEAVLVLATAVLVLGLLGLSGYLPGALAGPGGLGLSVSAGLVAMVLGGALFRRRPDDPGQRLAREAAVTLCLVGLPAPVFFGAYYAALLLGMTSG